MPVDFDKRLRNLRDRRHGTSTMQKGLLTSGAFDYLGKAIAPERYEMRSSDKATRYALGSMQAVNPDYTANSIAEGDRVQNQLRRGHEGGIPVAFAYQGSVPLDVHIRGVSDIDLLVLRDDFVTLDWQGPAANTYSSWNGGTPTEALGHLRSTSERILRNAFPEATVTTSGAKSITLTGGSLQRKVDVVPSHWHDSAAYQSSRDQKNRGVYVLDKNTNECLFNLPFMHIHQIEVKDGMTAGGAKKVIRLLKNLRNDSDYSASIKLSSYEIAGLVWHFSNPGLTVYPWAELTLLDTARVCLQNMVNDKPGTKRLSAPDGTRCIIDQDEKFTGLVLLFSEVNDLCEAVAREISPLFPFRPDVRKSLHEAYIP